MSPYVVVIYTYVPMTGVDCGLVKIDCDSPTDAKQKMLNYKEAFWSAHLHKQEKGASRPCDWNGEILSNPAYESRPIRGTNTKHPARVAYEKDLLNLVAATVAEYEKNPNLGLVVAAQAILGQRHPMMMAGEELARLCLSKTSK